MLIFKVFVKVNKSRFNGKNLRFLNLQAAPEKNSQTVKRRYLKPLSTRQLRPWGTSVLSNLFAGTIDKKIFQYPTVFGDTESIDAVLAHSADVRSFFDINQNCKLTNDIIQKLKELELFGLSVPQKFGGAGYTETETKYLLECAGYNPTVARFLGYKEDYGCKIINLYGSEEQKMKYLPALAEGKLFTTLAFLENSSLIDLSKIEAHVFSDLEHNHFVLNAEKKWVHSADKVDLFLVMAKAAEFPSDESNITLKFHIFLVDKNMPGVTVYKSQSQWAEEANLYGVSFKKVHLPFSSILGGPEANGFDILKYGISHSNLTDATLCLSLMKQMLHDALQFVEEKKLNDLKVRGHLLVKENIATLTGYIYVLESVIYFLTANFDTYEKPDLFNDAIMAKILAVDFLRNAIHLYTEIFGFESFKKSGLLEEALKNMQYYSVFDENIEYFKLMCAADGLISASSKLAQIIKILRDPYENPYEAIKFRATRVLRERKFKSQLNFKMELHESLSTSADIMEENLIKFQFVIGNLFYEKGSLAIYSEHALTKLAEVASYLFAGIVCLSRASYSVCYDLNNFSEECLIAQAFVKIMDRKIHNLCEEEICNLQLLEYYRIIGKNAFNNKEYPVEHPLSREF